MVSDERREWLLGRDRPARVIPAGLAEGQIEEIPHDEHTRLDGLSWDPADDHPHAVPGHDNLVHRHEHGHEILISASHPELLDHHRATSAIAVRPDAGGAPPDEPGPVHLVDIIAEATARVTGSSLSDLQLAAGYPGDLASVLGAATGEVHAAATHMAGAELEALAAAGVLDADDLDALDPGSLVAALLEERPGGEPPDGRAVVTRVLPPPDSDEVFFSLIIHIPAEE